MSNDEVRGSPTSTPTPIFFPAKDESPDNDKKDKGKPQKGSPTPSRTGTATTPGTRLVDHTHAQDTRQTPLPLDDHPEDCRAHQTPVAEVEEVGDPTGQAEGPLVVTPITIPPEEEAPEGADLEVATTATQVATTTRMTRPRTKAQGQTGGTTHSPHNQYPQQDTTGTS